MTFGIFNRKPKAEFTIGTRVILDDGREGTIESIGASPYYGDSALAAYVIALDGSWANYVAI